MTRYRINWDNGREACGTFPEVYTSKRAAESAARAWKREMVAIETTPAERRDSRASYTWEIIVDDCEHAEHVTRAGVTLCYHCGAHLDEDQL